MEPGTDFKYRRLTRASARSRFALAVRSRSALWLGPDHVLSIESDNFRESYKRFYFRDIQAILVQKTNRFRTWNIILGLFIAISLIFALAFLPASMPNFSNAASGGVVIFGVLAVFTAPILLVHLIRGPTCKSFLRTAVQIEELPSLRRIKTTRRVLGTLHPLIVAAQGGELSPDAVAAQMREWTEATPAATVAPTAPTALTPTPAPAPTATAAVPDNVVNDPNIPPRLSP